MSYLDQVIARADSPASVFIGFIVLVCLLAGLLGGDSKDGES